jgi:hypothetical protein
VAGRLHKSSERLRVEHVRFEGGPLRLKLSPPLLRGFHETDVVTERAGASCARRSTSSWVMGPGM